MNFFEQELRRLFEDGSVIQAGTRPRPGWNSRDAR